MSFFLSFFLFLLSFFATAHLYQTRCVLSQGHLQLSNVLSLQSHGVLLINDLMLNSKSINKISVYLMDSLTNSVGYLSPITESYIITLV